MISSLLIILSNSLFNLENLGIYHNIRFYFIFKYIIYFKQSTSNYFTRRNYIFSNFIINFHYLFFIEMTFWFLN